MARPLYRDAGEIVDAIEYRVSGSVRRVPRRLWARMQGPRPPAGYESNGCGPKLGGSLVGRLASWLIPDQIHNWPLHLACHHHDACYERGGMWADRREADRYLRVNVSAIIADSGACWAPRRAAVAWAYYVAVRLGGWCAFRYSWGESPQPTARQLRRAIRTGGDFAAEPIKPPLRERLGIFIDKRPT